MKKILTLIYTERTKKILSAISFELNSEIYQKDELTNFIYSLKENEYHTVVIENNSDKIDILKIVRMTKELRPEVPQIVISNEEDKQTISLIHQEGVFYKCVPPINKVTLKKIIQSSFTFYDRKNKF